MSEDIIQYGWQQLDGKIIYIFSHPLKVSMCFISSIENLKNRTDGKLVKFKIIDIEEVKGE